MQQAYRQQVKLTWIISYFCFKHAVLDCTISLTLVVAFSLTLLPFRPILCNIACLQCSRMELWFITRARRQWQRWGTGAPRKCSNMTFSRRLLE